MVCNAHSACETALHIYKCNFIPLLTSDLRHSGLLALSLCYSQYLYRRLTAFSVLVPQLLMHTGTCCAGGSNTEALADGPATTSNGNASSHAASHVLCISPYPHYRKDRPTNPCLYWLGRYNGGRFNLEQALGKAVQHVSHKGTVSYKGQLHSIHTAYTIFALLPQSWGCLIRHVPGAHSGPFRLDLGDVLYAPNAFVDGSGRALLVAWEQDLRSGGGFDYAGCLSLPRVLTLRGVPALLPLRSCLICLIQRLVCTNAVAASVLEAGIAAEA